MDSLLGGCVEAGAEVRDGEGHEGDQDEGVGKVGDRLGAGDAAEREGRAAEDQQSARARA
ncbi:hypothetical protein [Glycomyces tarimensis]